MSGPLKSHLIRYVAVLSLVSFLVLGCDGGGVIIFTSSAPSIGGVRLFASNLPNTPTNSFRVGELAFFEITASDLDFDMQFLFISQFFPTDSILPFTGPDPFDLEPQLSTRQTFVNAEPILIRGPLGARRLEFLIEDTFGNLSNVFQVFIFITL